MARKKIMTIIKAKILPYTLTKVGEANIARLEKQYPYDLIVECIDIGIASYFEYDKNGVLTKDSVGFFLNKLGGILHNKSQSPIPRNIQTFECRQK